MEEVIKELSKLDTSKSTQKSDIPANLVKVNYDKFSEFLYENFNNILETGNFPKQLKSADVKLKNEKHFTKFIRKTTDLLVSSLVYPKSMKDVYWATV